MRNSIKYSFILGATMVLASVTSSAKSMSCSDSTGKLRYSYSSYEGGVRPRPGTVLSSDKWTLSGQVIGEHTHYANLNPILRGIQGEFVESSKFITDDSHANDKPEARVRYTINVRFNDTLGGLLAKQVRVSCLEKYDTVPRPVARQ